MMALDWVMLLGAHPVCLEQALGGLCFAIQVPLAINFLVRSLQWCLHLE